ncbi:MAG: DNA mismatch repair protein MutS [Candidatus Dojkabacteria bacterium]
MDNTPMMKQYIAFKNQYPGKIVLYRMGDFFETFGDDAKLSSKVLNITLTKRDKNKNAVPLAGFPHKAIDQYLPKLVAAGYSVVIVDQLEDPKFAKGIVKRGVTRIVTPGTLDGEQANQIKDSNVIAFFFSKKNTFVSICDVSTGKFKIISSTTSKGMVENVISSYAPVEILLIDGEVENTISNLPVQFVEKGLKNIKYAEEIAKSFFDIKSTESIDIPSGSEEVIPVAMLVKYIEDTQLMNPKHIQKPHREKLGSNMVLDRATIRNLELIANSYSGDISNSLFSVLNNTLTRMGTRLLYSWILNPLIDKRRIDSRLDTVEKLYKNEKLLEILREKLDGINDIERITGKIGLNRVNARDLKALQVSLESSIEILDILEKELDIKYPELNRKEIKQVISGIQDTIDDNPPLTITEGNMIKSGFNKEVDELRMISGDSKSWIKKFEEEEKKETGITSLKVSFNKVFGYYIEVTRAQQDKVPDRYIRKQTLVNCERYITEELKEKENIIVNAQDNISTLELRLFDEFRTTLIPKIETLQILSYVVGNIDVLSSFAFLSLKNNYTRPEIIEMGNEDEIIEIEKGRHPIVESIQDEEYISNDTLLNRKDCFMAVLTGPNMSGKSTYIRQVATIVLLAQIGCFVPASKARISVVDRIFTRVGASDDLARGRSTFMVEMDEAANIVNNASKYSLIILDEIGRGTSTYDGVSIAWALAEYLVVDIKARTLFATHYHELLKLAEKYSGLVKNFNVLVEEDIEKGIVIFLRKIVEGGTDRSYGIYVAKMAGLPEKVIKRANEILESFEQKRMFVSKNQIREGIEYKTEEKGNKSQNIYQYPLFMAKESEIEREIQKLDVDNLTPIEALNKIVQWRKKI